MQNITIRIGMWYNHYKTDCRLAIPEMPDLGEYPHPQDVMRALGITYKHVIPSMYAETWTFKECSAKPSIDQQWLSVDIN